MSSPGPHIRSRPAAVQPLATAPRRAAARRAAGLLAVAWLAAAPARAADPLDTVRAFCHADGLGARLSAGTWEGVADFVTWRLEPAWDQIHLIAGYQVGTPRLRDGVVEVDVTYTVTADVRGTSVRSEPRLETRTYALQTGDGGRSWRIRAPAPPPHVFASTADPAALSALLAPDSDEYVSASALVWQLLRGAGWEIPYADTAALAISGVFTSVRTAEAGDLVVYYDGERPYHVGIVESEDAVVSATLNGGIRRAPFAAFAGEIRYRRPNALFAAPTPAPTASRARKPKAPRRVPPKRRR